MNPANPALQPTSASPKGSGDQAGGGKLPPTEVDHLVLAAATLSEGVAWCERTLGITPGPGGEHALFGTHNRLFKLTGERFGLCYFEVIAINPAAPHPGRMRWFGLDELDLSAGPRLVNLVARTQALPARLAALQAAGAKPGEALRASRQTPCGRLHWHIAVANDGRLDGALPTLIEWDDLALHPAVAMPASGVVLEQVALGGLKPATAAALALAGADTTTLTAPMLRVALRTPLGLVQLQSPQAG